MSRVRFDYSEQLGAWTHQAVGKIVARMETAATA
jgi:hypothetical protein